MATRNKGSEEDDLSLLGYSVVLLIAIPLTGIITYPILLILWDMVQHGLSVMP